jgi:hypothetical protein
MPNEELMEVFDTMNESEAMVVKGLLESSGIPALISALDAPQDVLPGVGGVIIRVPSDRAEEALQMIEGYRSTRQSSSDLEDEAASPENPGA